MPNISTHNLLLALPLLALGLGVVRAAQDLEAA
jgi:hypothetical protein